MPLKRIEINDLNESEAFPQCSSKSHAFAVVTLELDLRYRFMSLKLSQASTRILINETQLTVRLRLAVLGQALMPANLISHKSEKSDKVSQEMEAESESYD